MDKNILLSLLGTSGGPGNQYSQMFNPAQQYAPRKGLLQPQEPQQSNGAAKGGILSMLNPKVGGK